jgi:hypothetical protein
MNTWRLTSSVAGCTIARSASSFQRGRVRGSARCAVPSTAHEQQPESRAPRLHSPNPDWLRPSQCCNERCNIRSDHGRVSADRDHAHPIRECPRTSRPSDQADAQTGTSAVQPGAEWSVSKATREHGRAGLRSRAISGGPGCAGGRSPWKRSWGAVRGSPRS